MSKKICSVEGCTRKVHGRGLCSKHWQRYKRNGDTNLRIEYNGPRKNHPREYKSWESMRQRCLCKTHTAYHLYGGRGIRICEEWSGPHGFSNFLKDMGKRPHGKTLDRIDPNKGYYKENCRWATAVEQACNRRNNSIIPGVEKTIYNTWKARYRGGGKNLSKTFQNMSAAIRQRKTWEQKYSN